MRGRLFFHAPRPLNRASISATAKGAVVVDKTLATARTCSGKVTPQLFGEVIEWAAQEAKRPLQVLERRGAGRDHLPLVGVPETEYLKTWFLRAP